MCEIPIQYTREFILKLKLDENETLIKNTSLISSLITTDFLDILKTIETFAIDNIPTNNSKSKNQNYNKKKKYRDNCRIPAVRPQTFLNKVGGTGRRCHRSRRGCFAGSAAASGGRASQWFPPRLPRCSAG